MSKATHYKKNILFQVVAITLGLVLMTAKFVGWWLTNSNAILTDALESIINVLAGSFALYSLILSMKPRDENHPYGHGKVAFISAGFEGALIFIAGTLIIGKGIYNLVHPQEIAKIDIGILLVGISGGINYLLGRFLEQQGRMSNSLILIADGRHLKSDAYSSLGLLGGLILIYFTQVAWLDNVTAILFGGIILYTGFKLVRESVAGIMDEADYQLIENMVQFLDEHRRPEWIDVHNFRVIKYGDTLHIDCHVTLPWYFDVFHANKEIREFENIIATNSSSPVELFVHIDPCEPPIACTICRKEDCEVRKAAQNTDVQWTLKNIMRNQQHYFENS